ncbi:MAG TPA: hypothetical protein VGP48_06755 [Stellaceae bacterium]|jgi:hypothetical protein|nr:hypothetical protein [Stellaceae bacterium]
MADSQIEVQVTADTSSFADAMQGACSAAQASFAGLQQSSQAVNTGVGTLGPNAQKSLKGAKSTTDDWTKSFANLDHAFSASITGMVVGTETWQKAVKRLSQTALSDLVNLAQKELASWIAKETGMTAATTAGNATRNASNTSAQSGLLTTIAQVLARWLGIETAKTAATTAGNTARGASDTAAAAASSALAVARGMGMIEISAAEAAAAAFADFAELGLPGLAAAPEAAAAAFAATMSWGAGLGAGLFSAAGGAWSVPSDMLAMVHRQESILPAGVAQPMRDFFSGAAASSGGGGDSYAITIQAIDTQTGAQFLMNNAGAIAQSLARELRNGNATLRNAMRTT